MYTFSLTTKTIVFLYNYTEAHFVVVKLDINQNGWVYMLYNSAGQRRKGPSWSSLKKQMPLLEQLIRLASGFPEPTLPSTFRLGKSPQQADCYDYGIISISNAITLLDHREPDPDLNVNNLRLGYAQRILEYFRRLRGAVANSLPRSTGTTFSMLSFESQAAEILDFSASAPLSPFKSSAVSTPEAISRDVVSAACATTDPLAELPRRSRRIQETIEKKATASTATVEDVPVPDKASTRHQQFPTRLSRAVKIYLEKIQESLDPETLLSSLESALTYNKNTHHPPLKDGQISLLPHDSWDDVMVASTKELIRRFGDHLHLKTRSKLTISTPEEAELMIGEVPGMVFAPFYYQESWIMIQFLITSSCCRTEVYDPSDRLADDKDWKVLKEALRRIYGAVYGPDRKVIVLDGFGRVHRELSPAESRFFRNPGCCACFIVDEGVYGSTY